MTYNGYNESKKACNARYLAKFKDIKIRATEEEKAIIEEKAKAANKSVNRYLIDLGIGKE